MSHGLSSRPLRAACGLALAGALLPATALADTPNPDYAAFAGCPNRADISACQTVDFSTGSIGLGKVTVPVAQAVHLAGGASNTDAGSSLVSDSGSVLTAVSLPLPGGLGELTGDASSTDAVAAVPTLTSDPELTEHGFRLSLRFGLEGAGLPADCSIGTADTPVVIDLTTDTTTPPDGTAPISGNEGSGSIDLGSMVVTTTGAALVANAYAVPAASGCGDAVDAAINANAGLPAAAGASETSATNVTLRAALDLTKVFG